MGFLAIVLLTAGSLLVFSAYRGNRPVDVLRAVLRGDELPARTVIPTAAPTGTDGGNRAGSVPVGTSRPAMVAPVTPWRITSPYGMRWGQMHLGVDVPAPTGTPIRAAASGVVARSGWAPGAGNRVNITHNSRYETRYFHMSRTAASVGQRVTQGQVIGYVGSTGDSSGPHLHFEVWQNGSAVNPAPFVGGAYA